MKNKKEFLVLLLFFLLAFGIRAYLLNFHHVIKQDGVDFATIGKNLFDGAGYTDIEGRVNLVLPPFYAFLIGLGSLIFENLELVGRLISVVLGALLIIPIYFLAKKFYGRRVAYLAAFLIAIYPTLTYTSTIVYSESTYLFILFSGIYVGWLALSKLSENSRSSYALYLVAGLLAGLAYLTRREGFANVIIISFFTLFFYRKGFAMKAVKGIFLLLIGFLIISSPYFLFLHKEIGKWTVIGHTGIITSFGVDDEIYTPGYEELNFGLNEESTELKLRTFRSEQTSLLDFVFKNPIAFFKRYTGNLYDENLKLIEIFPLILFVIAGFGFFSGEWDRRRFKKEAYLVCFLAFYLLLYPAFYVLTRYLIPVIPLLIIWLAKGVVELRDKARKACKKCAGWFDVFIILFIVLVCLVGNILTVTSGQYGEKNEPIEHKEAGLWLKENVGEGKVIMARKPWAAFYAEGIFRFLPYADYSAMLKYACTNNIDYIIIDERLVPKLRPQLTFLLDENNVPEELKLVYRENEENEIIIYHLKDCI